MSTYSAKSDKCHTSDLSRVTRVHVPRQAPQPEGAVVSAAAGPLQLLREAVALAEGGGAISDRHRLSYMDIL